MPRYLLLPLLLALPCVFADTTEPPASAHDLSYSVGASLGERLRNEMPELQLDALIQGLQQAYANKPLAISQARREAILSQHEAQASEAAEQSQVEMLMAVETRYMATERARAGVRELPEGVLVTELVKGNGASPRADGRVQVRYVGKLPDGSVFDQSEQPQWFSLKSVIEGWQVALPQMAVGAKWRVVIPSAKSYGADGAGDLIPPFTPLIFEIELLGVAD